MKFNYIDDCVLLIGLTKYGAKKLDLIQKNFLTGKTVAEIKNRYKNLICGRASDNKIKRWKIMQFAPLRDDEKLKLQKAIDWFGSADKYELISRYFLTDRSPEFIKAELTRSESLVKKRKKYASLLSSNVFSDSPLPSLDFQIERDAPDRHSNALSYPPPQSIRSMEVEEADNSPRAPHDKFEEIILALSDNNAKMVVESNNHNRSLLIRQKSEENFEAEELEDSQVSSDDEETLPFAGINGMGKRFKKIGSEIFEFEEI